MEGVRRRECRTGWKSCELEEAKDRTATEWKIRIRGRHYKVDCEPQKEDVDMDRMVRIHGEKGKSTEVTKRH